MKEKTKKIADELQAHYVGSHRIAEICSILGTTSASMWLAWRIAHSTSLSVGWHPLAALVGLLCADFVSGFAHWGFDTWGSVDTPIAGKLAIRVFRHHHLDEKALTHHDYIETNGSNYFLAFPVALISALAFNPDTASQMNVFISVSLLVMIFFVVMTSQIHKWAHADARTPFIDLLQRAGLILSPRHHSLHHAAPLTRNYCITVGWLNAPLRAIRFFESLEWIITFLTGVPPRMSDETHRVEADPPPRRGYLDSPGSRAPGSASTTGFSAT